MLEGFDTQWSEITDKPFSENYRNLPAGEYTFKVRSRTYDGIWSSPAEFSFTILPHWTNTWWAWVLYLLAFLTIVGVIVQYRSRMLKRENLILEEKVKHRTQQLNKSIEDLKGTQSQLVQSEKMASLGELTFYDSVTGKPLFVAPRGRSMRSFIAESLRHGWPSFRD